MGTTERRGRRSRAQWRALIARAEGSSLGIAAFCRAEGIGTASFYTWRKRLAADAGPTPVGEPAFLDLGPLAGPTSNEATWDIELELGAGVVLRLRRG
jgi:hypothetical protein